jgi:hypothetical protein
MFEEIIETQIKAVSLIDGEWYVRLDGDLAGKVVGAVYDASAGETELVSIALSVSAVDSAALVQCISNHMVQAQVFTAARRLQHARTCVACQLVQLPVL